MAESVDRNLMQRLREESERTRDEAYPERARPTRPNRGRTRVYSVRLNEDEYEAVQQVADAAHLPASTLVRSWILARLDEEQRPAS
ncbi:MAG TPA: hypothetical protein VHC49_22400 [Mycobacteriales bacterium]|nr:hypothetical protein [Mycobacteriales bacterium]